MIGPSYLKRLGTRGRLPKAVFALEPSHNRASQERPCRQAQKHQGSSALEAEDGLLCPRRSVDPLGSVTDHSGWQATQALSRDAPWMGDITYGKDLPHIRFRASPNGQSWGSRWAAFHTCQLSGLHGADSDALAAEITAALREIETEMLAVRRGL